MGIQIIGWLSSTILLVTIGQQVWTQWKERSTKGVSPWLFLGQIAASVGFTLYSLSRRDWVFVCTNVLMIVSALIGYEVLRRNRRAQSAPAGRTARTARRTLARTASAGDQAAAR